MSTVNASMTVIGAGSYGTALAITLARNGHDVVLWGHDPKHIATLQRDRCNVAFLPDVPFLTPCTGKRSCNRAGGQPQHFDCGTKPCLWRRAESDQAADAPGCAYRLGDQRAGSGNRTSAAGRCPRSAGDEIPLAVISGPTFAKELAAGLPTAISLASTDQAFSDDLQQLLHCGRASASTATPILSACSWVAR